MKYFIFIFIFAQAQLLACSQLGLCQNCCDFCLQTPTLCSSSTFTLKYQMVHRVEADSHKGNHTWSANRSTDWGTVITEKWLGCLGDRFTIQMLLLPWNRELYLILLLSSLQCVLRNFYEGFMFLSIIKESNALLN